MVFQPRIARTVVYFHKNGLDGLPLCGAKPFRLVLCSLCLREVYVHIRIPWVGYAETDGHTLSFCYKSFAREPSIAPDLPMSADGASHLPFDRLISYEEAIAWGENDDPDLWRLCADCEVYLARHLRSDASFARTVAERIATQARRQAEREAGELARDARIETRRELAHAAGVKQRPRRKKLVIANPLLPRFSTKDIDPASAATAAADNLALARRKLAAAEAAAVQAAAHGGIDITADEED